MKRTQLLKHLKKQSEKRNQTDSHLENIISRASLTPHHTLQRLLFQIVSPESPTIANLMIKHPRYAKHYCHLIHSTQQNSAALTPGPSINRGNAKPNLFRIFGEENRYKDYLSEDFLKAIKPYLGKSYESLDCYELVIQGIKDLGFRYHGKRGVKARLMEMARAQGLPLNAYLTGEGLMQALSAKVFSKQIAPAKRTDLESKKIFEDIKPLLNKGYLLSFSTPTRGHVGIISRHQHQWTFLNSGKMDHNLKGPNRVQEVGEENLLAEIHNWVRFAGSRNELLQISLGRLDDQKLYAFIKPMVHLDKTV